MGYCESELFVGISPAECDAMMHCFKTYEKSYPAGATIRAFGQGARSVGILQNGRADVLRLDADGGKTILERLNAGSLFGEVLAFSGIESESVLVVCTAPCTVLFIDYEHIIKRCPKACAHHSVLVQNMLRLICEKTLLLSQRVEILSCRTIREKLLCYFALCARQNHSERFTLPFSLSALADYLCVDRSAMTREMGKLKAEGLLSSHGRQITLLGQEF